MPMAMAGGLPAWVVLDRSVHPVEETVGEESECASPTPHTKNLFRLRLISNSNSDRTSAKPYQSTPPTTMATAAGLPAWIVLDRHVHPVELSSSSAAAADWAVLECKEWKASGCELSGEAIDGEALPW
uniref:Uncharacterized protein n=1 Tax=Leersia perrieri TaxID=77586 RepID=A0A0D9W027_9ORYZ